MPYWKGSTPEQDAKVDRCVRELKPKKGNKSYAICIKAVRKGAK